MGQFKQWLVRGVLACFTLFLFCTGGFIAGMALHDPDTCWLLAIGRWIVQHQSLPTVDPISSNVTTYATIFAGQPLMQYQWLPEILFFKVYELLGLTGLLVITAIVLWAAYVLLPLNLLSRARTPYLISLSLVMLSILLAALGFLARPQIFSCLFLSMLLNLLLCCDYKDSQLAKRQVFLTVGVLALWANCHILFPLGILVAVIVSGSRLLEWALSDRLNKLPLRSLIFLPVLAAAATFLNPWGVGIWIYFFRILRSPINALVVENEPLSASDYRTVLLLFFVCLLIATVCILFRRKAITIRKLPLSSILLTVCAVIMGLEHKRLIAFCPLLLIGAFAELYWRSAVQNLLAVKDNSVKTDKSAKSIQAIFADLTTPRLAWHAINIAVVVAGVLFMGNLLPPTLPQGGIGCSPPFEAMDYLKKRPLPGRILNDPQFGSIMSWYLPKQDVFIDTRFSMFAEQQVIDYQKLKLAQPGWEKLLAKYQFDWAFLPPNEPITAKLKESGWAVIYSDSRAVVLRKPSKQSNN